ncbi:MAG TPA: ABC transporter permease subunit [Candidatus Angelobacter sp.]|nr:ABC transporter permease subunit [Candidatus Angelobacter sp.]
MAVYKRSYKAYSGPLTPTWSRFTVLTRYGLARLFDSRMFTAYTVFCFLPFLVGLGSIYFVHSTAAQMLLGLKFGRELAINNQFFLGVLWSESWLGFVLVAWAAPGMISKDFANHSIQLYLSRPLSRAEYLVGKVSVLAALLSCTTWIPALILFGVQAEMQGNGWGWDNLWIAGAIVVAGLLWIALMSLLSMGLAVWVKWRIAATALFFGVLFFMAGFGFAVNQVLRTRWGWLLNVPQMIFIVWRSLFRMPLSWAQLHHDAVPLWSAWASLLAICAFSLWLLNRRLRAREVERA